MELINAICTNWASFDLNAPIDWIHGPGWTLGFALLGTPMVIRWTWQGIQDDRRRDRSALYREAEAVGQARVDIRDRVGCLEIINW